MLDPEYRDASNCYPYQFLEICIPLCNDPIGLIQKGHLKLAMRKIGHHSYLLKCKTISLYFLNIK